MRTDCGAPAAGQEMSEKTVGQRQPAGETEERRQSAGETEEQRRRVGEIVEQRRPSGEVMEQGQLLGRTLEQRLMVGSAVVQRKSAGRSAKTGMDERVQRIWDNSLFQEGLRANRRLEQDRIFCKHDSGHLLDVARIAWIENLETGAEIPKYLIYAAALLHDIGRHLQYTEHVPHHEASARLAERILPECGFSQEETEQILRAILHHRDAQTKDDCGLAGLIYRADKRSRCCFACPAEAECDWDLEKKNLRLTI